MRNSRIQVLQAMTLNFDGDRIWLADEYSDRIVLLRVD